MTRRVVALLCLAFVVMPGSAPTQPASRLHFEVASIHPIPAPEARDQKLVYPMTISGSRVSFGAATLNNLISIAFALRPQQLVGVPSPTSDERYMIEAVMPAGATARQIPEMLLGLLEERFHMSAHRETRAFKGYALVKGNGPLRLNAPREIDRSICSPWVDSPSSAGEQTCLSRSPGVPGAQTVSASTDSPWGPTQTIGQRSDTKEEYLRITMVQLADRLAVHFANLSCDPSIPVWTPVEDRTGIAGQWDIAMQINMEDFCSLPEVYGLAVEKFGLKLQKATVSSEVLIVDRLDRMPSEN